MGGVRTDTSYPGTAHDQQFITQLVAAGRTPADAERRASRRQVFVPLGKQSQRRVLEAIWGVGGMSDTGGTEFDWLDRGSDAGRRRNILEFFGPPLQVEEEDEDGME